MTVDKKTGRGMRRRGGAIEPRARWCLRKGNKLGWQHIWTLFFFGSILGMGGSTVNRLGVSVLVLLVSTRG